MYSTHHQSSSNHCYCHHWGLCWQAVPLQSQLLTLSLSDHITGPLLAECCICHRRWECKYFEWVWRRVEETEWVDVLLLCSWDALHVKPVKHWPSDMSTTAQKRGSMLGSELVWVGMLDMNHCGGEELQNLHTCNLQFGVNNTPNQTRPNQTPKRFTVWPKCLNRTWVQFGVQ